MSSVPAKQGYFISPSAKLMKFPKMKDAF